MWRGAFQASSSRQSPLLPIFAGLKQRPHHSPMVLLHQILARCLILPQKGGHLPANAPTGSSPTPNTCMSDTAAQHQMHLSPRTTQRPCGLPLYRERGAQDIL